MYNQPVNCTKIEDKKTQQLQTKQELLKHILHNKLPAKRTPKHLDLYI